MLMPLCPLSNRDVVEDRKPKKISVLMLLEVYLYPDFVLFFSCNIF